MFAIDHAATALVLKRRYPTVPLAWLLVSVQLVEMLWVGLNLLGIERTSTDDAVRSVRQIHLAFMPWSHSIATSVVFAGAAGVVAARMARNRVAGIAVAVAVASHIVLDVMTHVPDIQLAPFLPGPRIGIGLYAVPPLAFVVELAYGILCWWIFRGGRALLLAIVGFNLANLSFFVEALPGPETLLAHRPAWIVVAIAVQIAVTLLLVGRLARSRARTLERDASAASSAAGRPVPARS